MKGSRSIYVIAAFLIVAPAMLWLAATVAHSQWCTDWYLTCTRECTLGGLNADWLMAFGLILAPYVLFFTTPVVFLVLLALVVFKRRRQHAGAP
jgi:hypothetical protein